MIKAVIFDWGGVVAPNPNGGWMNVLAEMLDMTSEELRPHWHAAGYQELSVGSINEDTFWSQFENSLGRPLQINLSKVWAEGSALHPWPEILNLIDQLRADGIMTAILSNTVRPLSTTLREMGQYDNFDVVVLSDEVGIAKPDLSIYKLVLNELGVKPEECIYVDDIEKNLAPATDMGMTTILASEDPTETIHAVDSLIKD